MVNDADAAAAGTACVVLAGTMWLTARGMMSNSLMWSPNRINLSALWNSIKTFQLTELENKRTYRHQFSPESEKRRRWRYKRRTTWQQ